MRPLKPLERDLLEQIADGNWHDTIAWPLSAIDKGWLFMFRAAFAVRFLTNNGLVEQRQEKKDGQHMVWVRITKLGQRKLGKE